MIVADHLDLADGTTVIVAADSRENECEISAEEMAELDAAIAEADADDSEPVPFGDVLAGLDRIASR